MIRRFDVGDVLIMKKSHPCATQAKKFAVLTVGSDIKLRCLSCGHTFTAAREKIEKHIISIEKGQQHV